MLDPISQQQLHNNLQQIQATMATAAAQSGRNPDAIKLVAVTKYVDERLTRELVQLGCQHLGESRPQQLWAKSVQLQPLPIEWHLIGHLQRNKAKRTAALTHWIHSVDSLELLQDLEQFAALANRSVNLLLEVNISGDATKHGLAPNALEPLLQQAQSHRHAKVIGLMGMASLTGGRTQAQRDFSRLRVLRDQLAVQSQMPLPELSMGMSDDFDLAIQEGATLVRVGSLLWEGLTR